MSVDTAPSPKFPKDRPEESLGFSFWQVNNLWQRRLTKALAPLDLTLIQFVLLAGIARLETSNINVTQVKLAGHQKTDVMMTSQVLRTLEQKGLISVKPMEGDRRANVLHTTSRGVKRIQKALDETQSVENEFFEVLGSRYPKFLSELRLIVAANEERL